jgi:ABC-2 type transport system ATP-binding protein
MREFLAEVNRERGVTVLLTTHDMADIGRLCSRLMIIDQGRLIYDGSLDAIKRQFGGERTIVVELEDQAAPLSVNGTTVIRTDGPRQWLRIERDATTAAQAISALVATARVRDVAIEEPEIEDIVRRIYQGELAPAG